MCDAQRTLTPPRATNCLHLWQETPRPLADTLQGVRILALLPAVLLAAIIWKLSDTPGLTVAHGALDTLLRKLAHVLAFGLLASMCVIAVRAQGVRRSAALASAAAIALVYAIVDEYHQSFVPTRHGAIADVAIDALGIGIASIVLLKLWSRRGVV
jgi:VanZ family protein